jgi:3-methyladenine DNA glycosylase Mpg
VPQPTALPRARDALQIYASKERIRPHKNKSRNHILEMGSSKLTKKLSITKQTEEKLNDRKDDGRGVSETERANKCLP